MISVRDLVFDYPSSRALFGISVDIPAGSVTALVGPNGAGKTTLMRCLAALEQPFSGSIILDDIDVTEYPRTARARLGYLQDLFGAYDRLTVRRCLAYAAAAHAVPADSIAARIDVLAYLLDLTDLLQRRAGELSRGQRQRLGIGQAIVHDPDLLILDEPASGLDPEARIGLADLLHRLQAAGMTILVSSHILAELEDYSTHLMILDRGRLVSFAPLGQDSGPTRLLRLTLAAPADLGAALAGEIGIAAVRIDGTGASFTFSGNDAGQSALLARLVHAGLPVLSFTEETVDMQRRYLAEVRTARSDRP